MTENVIKFKTKNSDHNKEDNKQHKYPEPTENWISLAIVIDKVKKDSDFLTTLNAAQRRNLCVDINCAVVESAVHVMYTKGIVRLDDFDGCEHIIAPAMYSLGAYATMKNLEEFCDKPELITSLVVDKLNTMRGLSDMFLPNDITDEDIKDGLKLVEGMSK